MPLPTIQDCADYAESIFVRRNVVRLSIGSRKRSQEVVL